MQQGGEMQVLVFTSLRTSLPTPRLGVSSLQHGGMQINIDWKKAFRKEEVEEEKKLYHNRKEIK